MTPQEIRKLERLAALLDDARAVILDLIQDDRPDNKLRSEPDLDAASFLKSLESLERSAAQERLDKMKHHELGAVFSEAGGPLTDKKKPKVWLIDQILWRVFDFDRGHEAIRAKGAS